MGFLLMLVSCREEVLIEEKLVYESPSLRVYELAEGLYRHETYLPFKGKPFPCNGMILVEQGRALLFDTPVYDSVSQELWKFIEAQSAHVEGVVTHHFHNDCLGGLAFFHDKGIPSYGQEQCRRLAKAARMPVPKIGFDQSLIFNLESKQVEIFYPGPGHSPDNIVSYFPQYRVLFGGCLVKEAGAGKGYLGDADTLQWPKTILEVERKFPATRWIVPGHGAMGDTSLWAYTRALFTGEK
jgi:metallo-beta-lactamase class B